MTAVPETVCPLCRLQLQAPVEGYPNRDAALYRCRRCGEYGLTESAVAVMSGGATFNPAQLTLLSHLVRRMQREVPPLLSTDDIDRLLRENRPPTPVQQIQNLVLWLGDALPAPGERLNFSSEDHRAIVGASTDSNFHWVLKSMLNRGILDGTLHSGGAVGTLSFDGWQLYQELTTSVVQSRTAFMAMPFGDPELDDVFHRCFKPAVARTGFDLRRLDERPPAGSIDDRLRVEIRRARFLVAELTGGNQGSYWEAGFAEGLGRPVIYTCKQSDFAERGTHFDTSHMHTVVWSVESLDDAGDRLAATIRATLPDDSVLTDPR